MRTVYVASMPVDFRKGATGLMALVRDGGADPFNGALYVFRSKRADRIKAVWFDGTGVCLFAKTLEDAIPLAPDWAGHVAIEPCTVACAGRWAGLEEYGGLPLRGQPQWRLRCASYGGLHRDPVGRWLLGLYKACQNRHRRRQ